MAIKEWTSIWWKWYWHLGGARTWVADQIRLKSNLAVLDVGTGDGLFIIQAAKKYPKTNFTGIEYSAEELEEAKENVEESGIIAEFVQGDEFKKEFKKKFDRIVLFIALRNIAKNQKELLILFKHLKEQMKPNGILAIAEMFKEDAKNEAQELTQQIYTECSKEEDTEHEGLETFFETNEVTKALEKTGFKITTQKFKTNTKLTIEQSKKCIQEEAPQTWKKIWQKYENRMRKVKGLEPDANITLILATNR